MGPCGSGRILAFLAFKFTAGSQQCSHSHLCICSLTTMTEGIDYRDRRLIWNLYNEHIAYVKIGHDHSSVCSISRGVR